MYCKNCGKDLIADSRFCPFCGFDNMSTSQQGMNCDSGDSGDYVGQYKKKNSGIALVLSFLITGLGQMYNGKITFGLMLLFVQIIFGVLGVLFLFPLIGCFVLWVYAMYDAYTSAEEYNRTLINTGNPPW